MYFDTKIITYITILSYFPNTYLTLVFPQTQGFVLNANFPSKYYSWDS